MANAPFVIAGGARWIRHPARRNARESSVVRLVLLGAPGSGKGTQGAVLADYFGVPHVSSGDLLRDHVVTGTELGRRVRPFLARGDLVPDALVVEVVGAAINSADDARGYLLDGFPRTIAQAERAVDLAVRAGAIADAVVYLEVADDVARLRLAARAQTDRSDDANPAAIDQRLAAFHAETIPVLDLYKQQGLLLTIDAEQPVDRVTAAILEALTERGNDSVGT